MRVFTFTADDPDSPVGAIARFHLGGKDGWAPVFVYGPDSATARQRAEEFWASELAKVRAKQARNHKPKQQPAAPADPGDVI